MKQILVIGSANADLVIHSSKMPLLGQTLTGSQFQVNAGGKGLNQTVAIAKLGGDVSFLGAVGDDGNGAMLLNCLEENGAVFKGLRMENTPTGVALITVVNCDNFILLDPGANGKLTPEIIQENAHIIAKSDYCVLQLEIPMDTICKVCQIAKANGTKIVLNPAPYQTLPDVLYGQIDYLIPNEHEAFDMTGICLDSDENCIKAVQTLRQKGIQNVIITLGEKGCVYNDGEEIVFCPAQKVTPVDTTSAGDSFVGAVVTKLQAGCSISQAVRYGTKVAAITISRPGAAKSIPFAREVPE